MGGYASNLARTRDDGRFKEAEDANYEQVPYKERIIYLCIELENPTSFDNPAIQSAVKLESQT